LKYWLIRLGSIVLAVGGCLLLDMVARGSMSDFQQRLIVLAGLYVTLAVSLNLINGITGQFSIGHAAFYQVGAYTTGILAATYFSKANLPIWMWLILMMFAGALAAAAAGLIVGLPSLRLRGDYLAVVTLGFGEIIGIIAKNQESLGKAYGMNVTPREQSIWLVWLLAIVTIAVCRNLLKNVHGLSFLAVREDEIASSAMGVNVTRVKVTAFVLGSAFAGAAGALLAHNEGFISPAMFSMDVSFIILTMVVFGGTGSITGSVIAAAMLFYIPEKMRDLGNVNIAQIAACAVAIIFAVAAIRRIMHTYHGPNSTKTLYYGASILISGVVFTLAAILFNLVPGMQVSVEPSKLRLVVFAVTLVILMLLRPQGIFAHHEFSWSWVKKVLFRQQVPEAAVSA
jgi:branched-chain amino acid transport system permease protein